MDFKNGDWLMRKEEIIKIAEEYTEGKVDLSNMKRPFLVKEIKQLEFPEKHRVLIKTHTGEVLRTGIAVFRKATPEEVEAEKIRMIFNPINIKGDEADGF